MMTRMMMMIAFIVVVVVICFHLFLFITFYRFVWYNLFIVINSDKLHI